MHKKSSHHDHKHHLKMAKHHAKKAHHHIEKAHSLHHKGLHEGVRGKKKG